MARKSPLRGGSRRDFLSPEDAKRVYDVLIPEGGDRRALGIAIRNGSRHGTTPTRTPIMTATLSRRVRDILKGKE